MLFWNPFSSAKNSAACKHIEDGTFDLLEPEFIANPYPYYDCLRKRHPIYRNQSGAWLITRYADVRAALDLSELGNAPSRFAVVNERNRQKYLCADVANNILPFMDAPNHNGIRNSIARSYFGFIQSHSIENTVQQTATEVLHPLLKNAEFDVIHDFGTIFSGQVMCRLMGLPTDNLKQLAKWSEHFLYVFSSIPNDSLRQTIDQSLAEFRRYFQNLIEEKRRNPTGDWISQLLNNPDITSLTNHQTLIIDNLMLFFADGIENIDRILGTGVKILSEDAKLTQLLHQNPELMENFVNELLRFETPVQFIARIAKQDFVFKQQAIKAQTPVLLMLGSANRDPEQFEQADQFRLHNQHSGSLSFGRGTHSCIGKTLVKLQLRLAFNELLKQTQSFSITQPLQWESRLAHRWLSNCTIKTT